MGPGARTGLGGPVRLVQTPLLINPAAAQAGEYAFFTYSLNRLFKIIPKNIFSTDQTDLLFYFITFFSSSSCSFCPLSSCQCVRLW